MLDQLGLRHPADRVYAALVSDPECSPARLAEGLGVPEQVVDDAIEQLCALGLAQRAPGAVWPVDPETGLRELLDRQHAQVLGEQQRLADSRRAVDRWLGLHRSSLPGRAAVHVERLTAAPAVATRLHQIARGCVETAWSFHAGETGTADGALGAWRLHAASIDREASQRAVYPDCFRTHPARNREARAHADSGAELRTVPSLPMWLLVVDRKVAVVPCEDGSSDGIGAIVVSEPGLVAGFAALFATTWRHGTPFGTPGTGERRLLSPREQHALELWVQGHTDTAVAKRLSVSERTVRRLSETVAKRLGARSRVEAAVRAVELGLLRASDLA